MIDAPGLYPDIPSAEYFADPTPSPSLTQSLAKILLEKSPLHAWHVHPRLNPDYRHDDDTKYDVGNIAHKVMIGRGKELVILDQFDDWRTKEARAKRDEAAALGKLAVLGKHFALADRMVRAAREQLELRGLGYLFRDGDGEIVTAWRERRGDFWCRQMIDWLTPDRLVFADYKTTQESAAPHLLARKLVVDGWDIQGAMGERGLNALAGHAQRRFLFVVQETEVPYCLTVVELSETALTMGRKKLAAAMNLWVSCLHHNRWPGYPLDVVVPSYPEWAEAQWLDREQTEFASEAPRGAELIMAG